MVGQVRVRMRAQLMDIDDVQGVCTHSHRE